MHAAIEKISVHENCRFNGSNHFHIRVYISFAQAVQLAEEVRIGFETAPVPPHCLGTYFKVRGLDCEIFDSEVCEGSGWQSLYLNHEHVSLSWDRDTRSYIDLSLQKSLTIDELLDGTNVINGLPECWWVEAAAIIKLLTAAIH